MSREHAGRSVEEMRGVWARRQVESIRSGKKDAVLIVRDTKEYRRRRALPSLAGEESSSDIHFDVEGNIYSSRWNVVDTEFDEDGKRRILDPENKAYIVLYPWPVPRRKYTKNLPLDKPVMELKLPEMDSIEAAIRQQRHVLKRYSLEDVDDLGEEIEFAQRVIGYLDRLSRRYLSGTVDAEKLQGLARETGNFLEKIGLFRPRDPDKRKVLAMLATANTKDSLGRVNPLISRVKARAAYIAIIRRLAKSGLILEKYDANKQVLTYERQITRWALTSAISHDQLGYYVLGHSFLKSGYGGTQFQRQTLVEVIKTIVEGYLSVARVKPYRKVARESAINLVGVKRENWNEDVVIFGPHIADIMHSIYRVRPVAELILEGDYNEARQKVERVVEDIREVLKENESIG